jgi:hypothetical protein
MAKGKQSAPRARKGGDGTTYGGFVPVASCAVALLAVAFNQCVLLDREFIAYDDRANFLDISTWREGSFTDQISWAFTTDRGHVFEPIAWILKSLQFGTFGLSASAFVLVSTAAHCVTAGVLFLILRIITGEATEFVALSVLWWAVHPQRVECICWCSAQPFVFAGLFGSLAIYCQALQRARDQKVMLGMLEVCFFALAVMSKAVALPLCLISIALDLTVFRFPIQTLSAKAIPNIASAITRSSGKLLVAAWAGYRSIQANSEDGDITLVFTERIALSMYCIGKYLTQLVVPIFISVITYPDNSTDAQNGFDNQMNLGCAIIVVFISLICIYRAFFISVSSAAVWFSFLAVIFPTLPVIPHGTENVGADRYTYLATWALLPTLCFVWKGITTRIGRVQGACVGLGILAVLAGYSASTSGAWSKNVLFYDYQIQTHPYRNPYFRESAIAYHEVGEFQKAVDLIDHYRENWKEFKHFKGAGVLGLSLTYSKALMDLKQEHKAIKYIDEILLTAPKDSSADQLKANMVEALMKTKQNARAYRVLKELENTPNAGLAMMVKKALATFTVPDGFE